MPKKVTCLTTLDEIAVCESADVLIASLRSCAADLLNNIARMAAILRRLDELGAAVEIDHALFPYIRLIANGQLSASCLVACAGDAMLLEKAVTLPLDLQEKFAENEPFKLLEDDGGTRMVHPLDMTKKDLLQLFRGGKPRTDDEQKQWRQTVKGRSERIKKIALDKDWSSRKPPKKTPAEPGAGPGDYGPRLQHSAVDVELNWAAKKVVAAAVKLVKQTEDDDNDTLFAILEEVVEEYLESTEAAA